MKEFFVSFLVAYSIGMLIAVIYRIRTGHWKRLY
jgi:hypothetical protein